MPRSEGFLVDRDEPLNAIIVIGLSYVFLFEKEKRVEIGIFGLFCSDVAFVDLNVYLEN